MGKLTTKRIAFVEHYLACWNATEAARRAKYKHPNVQGPRLLVDVGIQTYKQARLDEMCMTADEAMTRLATGARRKKFDAITLRSLELICKLHSLFVERHEVEASLNVNLSWGDNDDD